MAEKRPKTHKLTGTLPNGIPNLNHHLAKMQNQLLKIDNLLETLLEEVRFARADAMAGFALINKGIRQVDSGTTEASKDTSIN